MGIVIEEGRQISRGITNINIRSGMHAPSGDVIINDKEVYNGRISILAIDTVPLSNLSLITGNDSIVIGNWSTVEGVIIEEGKTLPGGIVLTDGIVLPQAEILIEGKNILTAAIRNIAIDTIPLPEIKISKKIGVFVDKIQMASRGIKRIKIDAIPLPELSKTS